MYWIRNVDDKFTSFVNLELEREGYISFPIVPNRLFSGRAKNNRHFRYPETKITNFKISGTRLGMTLYHCRLILETETEPGTKSRFHYLCSLVAFCSSPMLEVGRRWTSRFTKLSNIFNSGLLKHSFIRFTPRKAFLPFWLLLPPEKIKKWRARNGWITGLWILPFSWPFWELK